MSNKEMNVLAITAVIISILCLTVAFASLSTTLQVAGNSTVKRNTWSIKFKAPNNINSSTNSGFAESGEPTVVGNTVYFNLELTGLNEFVEFNLPIENDGTINAVLSTINTSKIGVDSDKIIVKVLDLSNNPINNGELTLNKGTEKTLKIRIEVDPNLPSFDIVGSSAIQTQIAFEFTQN